MMFGVVSFLISSFFAVNSLCYGVSQYHTVCLDKSWDVAPEAISRKLDESFRLKQQHSKIADSKLIAKMKYPLRAAKKVKNGSLLIEFSAAPPELSQKEVLEFDSSKFNFVGNFLRDRISNGMERAGFSNIRTGQLKVFDSKFRFIGFDIHANGPTNDQVSSSKYWLYTSDETLIITLTAIGSGAVFPKNEIKEILTNVADLI